MKHFKRIITISLLVLFQMIALQSISQTKYIIGKDTLILYSKSENRAIAALLYIGAYDKTINSIQANEVKVLQQIVSNYRLDSIEYSKQSSILLSKFNVADSTFKNTNTKYQTLQTTNKNTKRILYGSFGLNLLFLILLL